MTCTVWYRTISSRPQNLCDLLRSNCLECLTKVWQACQFTKCSQKSFQRKTPTYRSFIINPTGSLTKILLNPHKQMTAHETQNVSSQVCWASLPPDQSYREPTDQLQPNARMCCACLCNDFDRVSLFLWIPDRMPSNHRNSNVKKILSMIQTRHLNRQHS